ncbi:MAG TPA: hypothetical protein VKI19_09415, partial [Acidimicrobiales bacterium]|nr:hypothetical protein [Acidimicrobiales bacterium]
MIDGAGGGHHDVRRHVVGGVERPHVGHGHARHGGGRPEHVPSQRVARPQAGGQDVVDQVGRLVGVHQDLLEDDL